MARPSSKPSLDERCVDEWTDMVGSTYGPGDIVAVATISGRSPQMIVGEVVRILAMDPEGKPYEDREWDADSGSYRRKPSVKVTVQKMAGRFGVRRYTGSRDTSTYQFRNNIIKVS